MCYRSTGNKFFNMKNKSGVLADQIASVLNAAPESFDPENDPIDATSARLVREEAEEFSEDEEILSKFRKENVDLLADVDTKYAGRKTSREKLQGSDTEDLTSENSTQEEDDDAPDDSESATGEGDEDQGQGENDDKDDSDDSDGSGSNDGSYVEDESYLEEQEGNDTNFKRFNDSNISTQIQKGLCVRNQMAMWENLLETRIQLQKCLLAANKMPSNVKFKEIKQQSPAEFTNKATMTQNSIATVLDKLLLLQTLLLKRYPETKKLGKGAQAVTSTDNEEIPSDTDPEESEQEHDEPELKKRKMGDYEVEIKEQHEKYIKYRNNVIQKWYDKTRVVLKGGATSHSVLDQIEYNLSNKDKLLKRTQIKRSQYNIVGEDQNAQENKTEEYNCEIFDDGDFYHQLLRELIEVKSADITDPVQLGRQWIQLQNARSKMKRKIDTKATKGRKIRYAVHSKLLNFMAPIDESSWTDEAKNELYSSLFGKNKVVNSI